MPDLEGQDHARRLTDAGRQEARDAGKRLTREAGRPQRILTSPAARAHGTAAVIAEAVGLAGEKVFIEDALYLAEADSFLNVLRRLPNAVGAVFVVGHNPGISHLANVLTGREFRSMRTSNFVGLELDIDSWMDLAGGTGHAVRSSVP